MRNATALANLTDLYVAVRANERILSRKTSREHCMNLKGEEQLSHG